MKFCFLINPIAGKGNFTEQAQEMIKEICEKNNVDYEIFLPETVKARREYVKRVAQEFGEVTFFACGGDGTVCRTASAIMSLPVEQRERVSLGIVPMGTGNDFVSNFGNKDLFWDIEAQLEGSNCKIDVIKCNDLYSVNMINIGFDSHVVLTKEKIGKKSWVPRKLAYIISLAMTLIKKPGVKMTMSTDTAPERRSDLLLTTFANGRFCGGGFHSNPMASLFDLSIDCIAVKNIGRIKFLSLVGSYKKGLHLVDKYKKVIEHSKCHTANISLEKPTPVSVDGEMYILDELYLGIEPKALSVRLPKGVEPLCAQEQAEEVAAE